MAAIAISQEASSRMIRDTSSASSPTHKTRDEMLERLVDAIQHNPKEPDKLSESQLHWLKLNDQAEQLVRYWRLQDQSISYYLLDNKDPLSHGLMHLHDNLKKRVDDSKSRDNDQVRSESKDLTIRVFIALVITMSARYNLQWETISRVIDWLDEQSPEGRSISEIRRIPPLRIASLYHKFGETRRKSRDFDKTIFDELINDFDELIADIYNLKIPSSTAEESKYKDNLILFLFDVLCILPAAWIAHKHARASVMQKLKLKLLTEDERSQTLARWHYCRSQLYFALGELQDAQKEAMLALSKTTNTDLHFVKDCTDRLTFYSNLEATKNMIYGAVKSEIDVTFKTQFQEVRKNTEERLQSLTKEFKQQSRDHQTTLAKNMKEQVERLEGRVTKEQNEQAARMERKQEDIQRDIKETLLRVVEVLGIFMAIVGVIATAGIGAIGSDDLNRSLEIYLAGFGGVLVMLVFLGMIVHNRLRFWKKDDKKETSGSGA